MKGKEKRKGKEKETRSRASTINLRLILARVIAFGVPADDLYDKNWLQETGRHLSPVGGGRRGWTIQMATMVIGDATNMKFATRKAALQNLRS